MGARHHRGVVREVRGEATFGTPMTVGKLVHRIEAQSKRVGDGSMPIEVAASQIIADLAAHGRTRASDAFLAIAARVAERVRGGGDVA